MYERLTSKKEKSQSMFLKGSGSRCENRRSFLTLESLPCGTVMGHGIPVPRSALSSHPPIPPGPHGFHLPPPPACPGQGQRQQMDTHSVIITMARRLEPFPCLSKWFICYTHWCTVLLQQRWVHQKVGRGETTVSLQITALCISKPHLRHSFMHLEAFKKTNGYYVVAL